MVQCCQPNLSGVREEMAENGGGRYRIRTCDLLGVNAVSPCQPAVFSPADEAIFPLAARFVPLAFKPVVHFAPPEPLGKSGYDLPDIP